MLRRSLFMTMAVVAGFTMVAHADPKDDITTAAKALGDSANYSWTTTTANAAAPGGGGGGRGFGGGAPVNGKTEKDGYTTYNISMRQAAYEVVSKGTKSAIKTPEGTWTTVEEMTKAADPAAGFSPATMVSGRVSSFKAPADQVADMAGKLENIKKTDTGYTADMSEAAAKDALSFRRPGPAPAAGAADAPPPIEIKGAKGTVTITISNGAITKFETHLTGTMSFGGNDNPRDTTTTTEIKDVGSTKVDVPAEAKAKLGG